jgi:hypothetical protein
MYMPKKTKLKARRKIRQKTRKYRKYGGTPPRLAESKKNVAAILSRLQASQDQSRSNIQKMYEYIKRLENDEPGPAYDLGQARLSPTYQDLVPMRLGSSPLYQDLGAMRLSSSPLYQDLGPMRVDSSPLYQDLAQADYNFQEALLQLQHHNIIDILMYNSDSGDRDLTTAKTYNKDIPFIEILKKANELKAPLIVKTSYVSDDKPGAWYIKGANSQFTYEEIKSKIEENVKNKKYKKRICYLIQYDSGHADTGNDLAETHPSPAVFAKIIKNLADKSQVYSREDLIKLTPENASKYLGYNILFGSRNQYITKKILAVSKTGKSIQIEHPDLKNSLEIVSRKVYVILKKSPLYDLGRAMSPQYDLGMANGSPVYDLGMATGSPVYDLGMANASPVYDLGRAASPEYDLGMANEYDLGMANEYDLGMANEYDLGMANEYDLGMANASPEYDELKVEPTKLDIAPGSWFFYTLKIVDSQPKTEKELCEIMKVKYPVRLTGKTPCNTLNRVLQILAKNGYISRMPFTSAKGTARSSAKGTAQKRQKYKYFVNDDSVV